MKLLALETASDACSAALFIDGVIEERYAVEPRQHTQLLLPMVDSLMAAAQLIPQQLDAVAVSRGPGSFTGVRIAGSVAQGIAFGADLPIVPVSTLAALAQACFNQQPAIDVAFVAVDARMQELFWGIYQRNAMGIAELLGEERVAPADAIAIPTERGFAVGSGWAEYPQAMAERMAAQLLGIDSSALPHAAAIAQIGAYGFANGHHVAVEQAMPVYLRDKVAKKQSER